MTVEVHLKGKSMEVRIRDLGKNSGEGAKPDTIVKTGDSDRRTYHNLHPAGHYTQPNTQAKPTADSRVANNPMAKSQGGGVG